MVQKDRVYYRLKTHLEMLQDRVRCLAYQRAVEPVVRDKIVLDVGIYYRSVAIPGRAILYPRP
jgi:hypothetical protein